METLTFFVCIFDPSTLI